MVNIMFAITTTSGLDTDPQASTDRKMNFLINQLGGSSGKDRDHVGLHMTPPMDPNDWGGTFAEVGRGLKFFWQQDNQSGNRLPDSHFFKSL